MHLDRPAEASGDVPGPNGTDDDGGDGDDITTVAVWCSPPAGSALAAEGPRAVASMIRDIVLAGIKSRMPLPDDPDDGPMDHMVAGWSWLELS